MCGTAHPAAPRTGTCLSLQQESCPWLKTNPEESLEQTGTPSQGKSRGKAPPAQPILVMAQEGSLSADNRIPVWLRLLRTPQPLALLTVLVGQVSPPQGPEGTAAGAWGASDAGGSTGCPEQLVFLDPRDYKNAVTYLGNPVVLQNRCFPSQPGSRPLPWPAICACQGHAKCHWHRSSVPLLQRKPWATQRVFLDVGFSAAWGTPCQGELLRATQPVSGKARQDHVDRNSWSACWKIQGVYLWECGRRVAPVGGCWWQGCVALGILCCPTAWRFQQAPAHHHLPSVIRKQELPQAVNQLFTRLCQEQGRGTATQCVPSPQQLENPPESSDGLCHPSRSLDPNPALQMAAAPCTWCHVPGTKDSVTKAGSCAHCRPPPLQELHLLHHCVPGARAQHGAPCSAASLLSHAPCVLLCCCCGIVSWAQAVGWKSQPALPLQGSRACDTQTGVSQLWLTACWYESQDHTTQPAMGFGMSPLGYLGRGHHPCHLSELPSL